MSIVFEHKSDFSGIVMTNLSKEFGCTDNDTTWKMSKYGVFSGPDFSVFSPNTGKHGPEKLRIWTLFTQCQLLIAKLHAYCFSTEFLEFRNSYLPGRKQRVKINSPFSKLWDVTFDVSKGLISDPVLFNDYIYDLSFSEIEIEFGNYADDTTP